MTEKCRKKLDADIRNQFHDPKQRELMRDMQIQALKSMNLGAQTSLKLSDQEFNRILEIQADQSLATLEARLSHTTAATSGANEQIAAEFGEPVAAKWAKYEKEGRGRLAARAVADVMADAEAPLSDEQRRKLVSVYADEMESQGGDFLLGGLAIEDDNGSFTKEWFEKQQQKRDSFEQRVEAKAASFLTPTQMDLLRKKSDIESEQFRKAADSMPDNPPVSQKAEAEAEPLVPLADC